MIENHHDWKIHKILDEAKRVYIYPARCNGKTRLLEELGYEPATYYSKPVTLGKKDVERIKDYIVDYDLYHNLVSPMYKDSIDLFIENVMKEHYFKNRGYWVGYIRPFDDDIDWQWCRTHSNPYLTNVFKVDDSNLD